MPDPTPEHLASLARVLDPANIKSRGYLAITPHEAAKALYAAVRTDPHHGLGAGTYPLRIGHLLADAHTVVIWPCGCWITDEQAEPILASRAWAVWDRKRRARRKR